MHGFAAGLQFLVGEIDADAAAGDVDLDAIAFLDQADGAALGGFGRDVADGQAGGAAGETTIGDQGTGLAEPLGFEIAGGVEHLLHAGPALRAFVADDDHVAGLDAVAEDGFDGGLLAFEDARRAAEHEAGFIDPGGLDHAAVDGDVAEQHRQSAILAVGVFDVADAAVLTVEIEAVPALVLAEGLLGRHIAGGGLVELDHRRVIGLAHIPLLQRSGEAVGVDHLYITMQQAPPVQLAEKGHHTTGAMYIFHVVELGAGGDLAQVRHLA